ncbi:hypothetical protein [Streptomyces scabiei]|uniref:hypothetical protein n=1 Tax=Streptomyces scabiei TaxID=1930 RepID=UPI000765C521|nr:hypothetical protein [Streptomyces scabiei]
MAGPTELDGTLADLDGFTWIPGIADLLRGYRALAQTAASGQLTADDTQTALALLGNPHGPDLIDVQAQLVKNLTDPATNPGALAGLPDKTTKQIQHLGEIHAFETRELAPRDNTNEAAGLLYEATAIAPERTSAS